MDLTTQRKVVFGRIAELRYEGSGTGLSCRRYIISGDEISRWPGFCSWIRGISSSLLGQPDGSNLNSQLPREWYNVANETGQTGRLVANVFQEIAPVLHRHGVDMVFADVQGANAPRLPPKEKVFPDFVLHSPTGEVRLVGEMKTSWTADLDNLWSRAERKFLAQVFRYMDDYGTLYGCACTYEEAVFLKRTGPRTLQVSPVIKHITPSVGNPIKPSLRECFFAMAAHITQDQNWKYSGTRVGRTLTRWG